MWMDSDKGFNGTAWIIVEEYEPLDHEDTLTNVLPYWYSTEEEAIEALREIAKDLMVEVDPDVRLFKFLAPPEDGIFRDTYYIKELDRG